MTLRVWFKTTETETWGRRTSVDIAVPCGQMPHPMFGRGDNICLHPLRRCDVGGESLAICNANHQRPFFCQISSPSFHSGYFFIKRLQRPAGWGRGGAPRRRFTGRVPAGRELPSWLETPPIDAKGKKPSNKFRLSKASSSKEVFQAEMRFGKFISIWERGCRWGNLSHC